MNEPKKEVNLKNIGQFGVQAFFGGCIGCFGAWVTTVTIILLASLIFGSVFYNSVVNAVNSLSKEIPAILQGAKGPFSMGQSSMPATPTGTLPALVVYITNGEDPQGKPLTTMTQSESPQTFFWVKTEKGVNTSFILWMTTPEGSSNQFGYVFTTKTDGSPRSCGRFATQAQVGEYKVQAFIGSTVVGELKFTVLPN